MDGCGVSLLRTLAKDIEKMGIQTLLARANGIFQFYISRTIEISYKLKMTLLPGPIIEMMEKYDKLESGQNKMRFTMFPSVHDAVLYALSIMQSPNPIITSM